MTVGISIRTALVAAALMGGLTGAAGRAAAGPLTLTGQITAGQTSYSTADLAALGAITATVNGNSYVGASLWKLLDPNTPDNLNDTRIVPTATGSTNNRILSSYVLAIAADGRHSLISVGEMIPAFGGTGAPYLIAYRENGVDLATPKLLVLDDPTGLRSVQELVSIDVRSDARPSVFAAKGTPSKELQVKGTTGSAPYNLAGLKALDAIELTLNGVSFGGGTPQDYMGVNLWELIKSFGVGNTADILTSYLVAGATDGLEVVFSLAELNPAFHASGDVPDLVAYAATNRPLSDVITDFGSGGPGFARMVKPGDSKGGRYVSNLTDLSVVVVPAAPTVALLALGLFGMLPLVPWRRPAAQKAN